MTTRDAGGHVARGRQSWTANAAGWARAVRDGAIPSRRAGTDEAVMQAVLRGLPPRGHALDMGCGEGWLARALTAAGATVHGVDGSAPLIDLARERGGSFDVLGYDEAVSAPSRLGGPFDVAVFNFALLTDNDAPVVRAAASRLADGGRVVIQTVHPLAAGPPYRDGWREESFTSLDGDFEPMPWYFRTLASWVGVLADAGLRLGAVDEPTAPDTEAPLSLVLTAVPA
ncbi:class I SAM-dependent methyltransferase [Rubrivirga sp. IMCC43871]|uniref:class I SAM-dependent methyltransferase n=1 Tax=Rubrivirga sp. IMCC43871 TaxID=3391575 RepID=UPI003990013C